MNFHIGIISIFRTTFRKLFSNLYWGVVESFLPFNSVTPGILDLDCLCGFSIVVFGASFTVFNSKFSLFSVAIFGTCPKDFGVTSVSGPISRVRL